MEGYLCQAAQNETQHVACNGGDTVPLFFPGLHIFRVEDEEQKNAEEAVGIILK